MQIYVFILNLLHVVQKKFYKMLKGSKVSKMREQNQSTPRKRLRLQYCFQYGNGEAMRQQTEVREDLRCPWCSLQCPSLFGLLKHLRLSHARFNFIYVVSVGDNIILQVCV